MFRVVKPDTAGIYAILYTWRIHVYVYNTCIRHNHMCIYAVYSDLYTIFVPCMIYSLEVLYNISLYFFVLSVCVSYVCCMYREPDAYYDSGGCGRDRLL